ncbi:MAG: hypothetical protein K0R52_1089 [Alphaproteobacteria bacterium]|jgi:hypothetical protein|nr:hypothetical protein [Alphaproteobacteria bacterium]
MIPGGQPETRLYKEVSKSTLVMTGVRGVHSTVRIVWETR